MIHPAEEVPEGKKASTSWTTHVHLPGIKQLSSWTPQGLIKRSASISRSGSPSPRQPSSPRSDTPSSNKNGTKPTISLNSDHHSADSSEIKESLFQLLSGCYHEAAGHKHKRKCKEGQHLPNYESEDSLDTATESTASSSSSTTLIPPLTSESSEDDEEEDEASDSDFDLLPSPHEPSGNGQTAERLDKVDGYPNYEVSTAKTSSTQPSPREVETTERSEQSGPAPSAIPDALEVLSEGSPSIEGVTPGGIHTLNFVEEKAGKWPIRNGEDYETLIASVPAVQCRTVMIKGTLYLTNKRLVFYAWVALDKAEDETTVLQEGVLTFVYPQKWKGSRRVYCVLSPYGVASYTSATDRLHPRSARSLSAFKEVTMDPENPLRFRVEEMNGSYRWVYTDTEEHTRRWYNAMQAALFRYRYRSDHVLTSVPLSRVESFKFDDIMDVSLS